MPDRVKSRLYYPMLVSVTGDLAFMPKEEDAAVWKKYLALPQKMRDILTDAQMQDKITALQQQLGLSEEEVGVVSLGIRKLFFKDWSREECGQVLVNKLLSTKKDGALSEVILNFIEKEIFTIEPHPELEDQTISIEEKRVERKMVAMALLPALSKYMKLAQHQVTKEKIKLKTQAEPVRPTLINWLRYYRSELGIGFHNSVERGEFLYQSENCRKLSAEERERINLILKSVEEDAPLDIDIDRFEIVFPAFIEQTSKIKRPLVPLSTFVPKDQSAAPVEPHRGGSILQPRAPASPSWSDSVPSSGRSTPSTPVARPTLDPKALRGAGNNDTGIRFSSPHVFQAEKESQDTRLQSEGLSSQRKISPQAREKNMMNNQSPQGDGRLRAFANPPLAPARKAEPVPRVLTPNPALVFNRFNITPTGYSSDKEKEKDR